MLTDTPIKVLALALYALMRQRQTITVEEIESFLMKHSVKDGKADLPSATGDLDGSGSSHMSKFTKLRRSLALTGCLQEVATVATYNVAAGRTRFGDYDPQVFYPLISPYVSGGRSPWPSNNISGLFSNSFIRKLLTASITPGDHERALVILQMSAYAKTKVDDFSDIDIWLANEHDRLVAEKQIEPALYFERVSHGLM